MSLFLKNLDLSKLLQKRKRRTGRKPLNPFPVKLYRMLMDLAEKGQEDIVSWGPGGASFLVHDHHRLVTEALPAYFNQTKYKSFQRQLNFYGFARILDGPLEGSYSHPMFLRGQEQMCRNISRKEHHQSECTPIETHMELNQEIVIPERTPEEEQEVEFKTLTKQEQHPNSFSRVSFENAEKNTALVNIDMSLEPIGFAPPALLFQESILTLPAPTTSLQSQQSSMFGLPLRLMPQESILANGHTAHNFGKTFFYVENDTAVDEPLPLSAATTAYHQ
ncbi:MAG: hypothetical protein SGBAC_011120 [Bacillariaceae sp.]